MVLSLHCPQHFILRITGISAVAHLSLPQSNNSSFIFCGTFICGQTLEKKEEEVCSDEEEGEKKKTDEEDAEGEEEYDEEEFEEVKFLFIFHWSVGDMSCDVVLPQNLA